MLMLFYFIFYWNIFFFKFIYCIWKYHFYFWQRFLPKITFLRSLRVSPVIFMTLSINFFFVVLLLFKKLSVWQSFAIFLSILLNIFSYLSFRNIMKYVLQIIICKRTFQRKNKHTYILFYYILTIWYPSTCLHLQTADKGVRVNK